MVVEVYAHIWPHVNYLSLIDTLESPLRRTRRTTPPVMGRQCLPGKADKAVTHNPHFL